MNIPRLSLRSRKASFTQPEVATPPRNVASPATPAEVSDVNECEQLPPPSRAAVFAHVDTLTAEELRTVPLRQQAGGEPIRGATSKFISEVTEGPHQGLCLMTKRYPAGDITPLQSRASVALRRAAGQPAIQSVGRPVALSDGKTLHAEVTAMVPGARPMPRDPKDWNASQLAVVLETHAANRWLRERDGKIDQYVAFQPAGTSEPTCINVDVDHSLAPFLEGTLGVDAKMSRYDGLFLTPAENRLWIAYVRDELRDAAGKPLELDVTPLYEAIGRIEKLSRETIRESTRELAETHFAALPAEERAAAHEGLVDELVTQQRALRSEFDGFLTECRADRERYRDGHHVGGGETRMRARDKRESARHELSAMGFWKYLNKLTGLFSRE